MFNLEKYLAHISFETAHRKKWIKKAVHNKRYIRGMIQGQIKEHIHSRDTGDRTTDTAIRRQVLRKTGGKCYLCLRSYNPNLADLLPDLYFKTYQVDHVIPFAHFGPNTISNYMPICAQCNRNKSDTRNIQRRFYPRTPQKRSGDPW